MPRQNQTQVQAPQASGRRPIVTSARISVSQPESRSIAETGVVVPDPPNRRQPPMVQAMHWVSQVTSIALEMILPALLGLWLDNRWGTAPGLAITGAVLGFFVSMNHLLGLARRMNQKSPPSRPSDDSAGHDDPAANPPSQRR